MFHQQYKKQSLLDSLEQILEITKTTEQIQIKQILTILASRGSAALLIICSLPFYLPIQIPGLSTPFGIILSFLGLRIAFGKRPWWPKWVLEKNIKSQVIANIIQKTKGFLQLVQKILHSRLIFLIQHPFFHRLNGIVIFLLAVLLSLPLPIPMTNLIAAFPLLLLGLGLLEDDGIFILAGYFFAFLAIAIFVGVFILGINQIKKVV
jgi:hypothetical protein